MSPAPRTSLRGTAEVRIPEVRAPAVRALGRELHSGAPPRRRLPGVAGWVLRHLPELAAGGLLLWAWRAAAERLGAQRAGLAGLVLLAGLVGWPRSRRLLAGIGWCLVTRSRVRAALVELRLCRRDGRPPVILAVLPTAAGEQVWLLCPVRIAAEDIAEEADRLRAACFARAVQVNGGRRVAALVRLDVIRRELTAAPAASPAPAPSRGAPAGGAPDVPAAGPPANGRPAVDAGALGARSPGAGGGSAAEGMPARGVPAGVRPRGGR